jgi:hypothetical protein
MFDPCGTERTVNVARKSVVMAPLLASAPALANGQEPGRCAVAEPGSIVVCGDVPRLVIPADSLKTMPRVTFTGEFHDGRPARFDGVTIWQILQAAGLPDTLRSGDLTSSVLVEAADGYRVLFALAEFDPAFRAEVPLLADLEAGEPIAERFGPLQVIVPGELRQARWVRQVECLRVVAPPDNAHPEHASVAELGSGIFASRAVPQDRVQRSEDCPSTPQSSGSTRL